MRESGLTIAIGRSLGVAIAAAGWRTAPARDPISTADHLALLRPLYAAGRHDLPLGRLLEGHVDAVQIVQRYGTSDRCAHLRRLVAGGAMLGVWNASIPAEPLLLRNGRLDGAKSFASGAGVLSHALVTADTSDGPQLVLVDLARTSPAIDRDWWHTTGMQRSETHQVRWFDAVVAADDAIGSPGDYAREPFFSGGALRFATVQAGAVAGLFDRTRDHLVACGRADDPFQAARLAELFGLADTAAGAVRAVTEDWVAAAGEAWLARVASARLVVAAAAARATALAQEAVGVQGLFLSHPLSTFAADLAVYLRQPAPDAQRLRVGKAAGAGLLVPAL